MADITKTAIVTGASRGIGAGLVEAFLKRGYNVVANSRNITRATPFAAGANVALVDGDIGHPDTAATIVDTAVSRFGRIDVLINNAGVFIPKPFTEYTTEDFNTLVSGKVLCESPQVLFVLLDGGLFRRERFEIQNGQKWARRANQPPS